MYNWLELESRTEKNCELLSQHRIWHKYRFFKTDFFFFFKTTLRMLTPFGPAGLEFDTCALKVLSYFF